MFENSKRMKEQERKEAEERRKYKSFPEMFYYGQYSDINEYKLLPLLRPTYERIENINSKEEQYLGREGILNFMNIVENDKGVMDLVSMVGETIIQRAVANYSLCLNPNGFYFSSWDRWEPRPEFFSKEKILDENWASYNDYINVDTVKVGVLYNIRKAPWESDGWFRRGSSRLGRKVDHFSTDFTPFSVDQERFDEWCEKYPDRIKDPAKPYRRAINLQSPGLGDSMFPKKD